MPPETAADGPATDDGRPALDIPPEPYPAAPLLLERQLHQLAKDAVATYRKAKFRAAALQEALEELRTAYRETVRALAFVVEAKDAYTGQHLERCRLYGVTTMKVLGLHDQYPDAEFGFLLHDAGKVGVPERILGKPGPLSAAEWRVMRTHPLIGYQIVAGIPFLKNAAEIVRSHHEMFDGSGYPAGLRRDEIPVPARVFAVVDAFDAMTTDRPYRSARSVDYAVNELLRMAGTQCDPEVVEAFVPISDQLGVG